MFTARTVSRGGGEMRSRRIGACVVLMLLSGAPATAATQPVGDATATVETTPVLSSGDAADDPAIWVHPTDPARSVVIGNDKGGALEVYDLSGARIQRIAEGFFGNVDVRGDLVAVYRLGLRLYRIDPVTRTLSNVTDHASGSFATGFGGEGLCLWGGGGGQVHAFVNARDGRIAQYVLGDADADGLVEAQQVRAWDVGGEVEGCVADDGLGQLYVSEEDIGIWKYAADPGAGLARTRVDAVVAGGGRLLPDIEGLAIVYQPGGTGYLMVSSQAGSNTNNFYAVYERQGANTFLRTFRVVAGPQTDSCGWTDGIDAVAANLGPAFPNGMFVCQDNQNLAPGTTGNQNFKFVPLERVVGLDAEPPPPSPVAFRGVAQFTGNVRTATVVTPGTTQPGDGSLLFASLNVATVTVTPPAGWTQVANVVTGSQRTFVWQRVAVAGDAGRPVSIGFGAYTKVAVQLAAYGGTAATDPVAAFAVRSDPANTTSHPTPVVAAGAGSWLVSYWADKSSTTTDWVPPGGVGQRSELAGTGSGRIAALLADSGAPVPAGTVGGLVATTNAASRATTVSIVLTP